MKLNYMQCWNDAMALLRDHKEAVLAIAGVFVFLPTMLSAQFVGQPAIEGVTNTDALTAAYAEFFAANAPAIIILNLLISFGGFALFCVLAPSQNGTVADSLGKAARLFLFVLIANIMTGLATFAGLLLLIIPGLYIASRLALVPPVIADHEEKNPIASLGQSWAITKQNGFAIFFLIIIIAIIGAITIGVIQMVIGVVTGLLTAGAGWPLIDNLIGSIGGTALQLILIAVIASIYRQLTGADEKVAEVFN